LFDRVAHPRYGSILRVVPNSRPFIGIAVKPPNDGTGAATTKSSWVASSVSASSVREQTAEAIDSA